MEEVFFLHDFQGLLIKFFYVKITLILSLNLAAHLHRACGTPGVVRHTSWESLQSIYLFYLNQPPPSITSYYSWLTSVSWISPFSLERDSSINQETELVAFFLLACLSLSLSPTFSLSLLSNF